jgi:uncharacterized protein
MSGLFTIPIGGLKEGRYTYDFDIDSKFFNGLEESEVNEGELKGLVEVEKRSSHIDLTIRINGLVSISCDRCLGIFSHPVDCENRLLVKLGKIHEENDPDIITVPVDENELDLRQYFFEYILLALPIQRVHPENSKGESACDPDMIAKLREHIVADEPGTDPRWDELKKLIDNN